jgi:propanediol utilization protein
MASVIIEISARHVHLTAADWAALFGPAEIVPDHAISQPSQFVATQRVKLRGPRGEFENVGVVGPFREYTQVELAASEARHLGLTPPVAESGQLDQAAEITVIGPAGEITKNLAIISQRHLHCHPDDATQLGFKDGQIVSAVVIGPRGSRFDNVVVRVNSDYALRLHLDIDEGNACGWQPGLTAEIV